MTARPCSECGQPLPEGSRRDRKTCGDACRQRRRLRVTGGQRRATEAAARANATLNEMDAARAVAIERATAAVIEPLVREQITDATLEGITRLLSLNPVVAAVLQEDLQHTDPRVRHKAAELILRYSMSDKQIPEAPRQPTRVLLEGMPAVGSPPAGDTVSPALPAASAAEFKACARCGEEKLLDEYEAGAPRCRTCQAEVQAEWAA